MRRLFILAAVGASLLASAASAQQLTGGRTPTGRTQAFAVDETGHFIPGNSPSSDVINSLTPTAVYNASSQIAATSAKNVYSVAIKAGATAGNMMVFNSTTVPADGAVTPQACVPVAANATQIWDATTAGIPERFTTGVVIVFSSGTSCLTKTAIAAEIIRSKVF